MTGFEAGAWQGVMVPAKTPVAAVERLNAELMKALKDPGVLEKLRVQGAEPLGSTPRRTATTSRAKSSAGQGCQKHGRVPGLKESKTMTILDGLSLTGIPPEGEALRAECALFCRTLSKAFLRMSAPNPGADTTRPSAASWVKKAGSA
jgi:hypothetical protein